MHGKIKGLPNVGWQQNAASDAREINEIPVHLIIITDCLLQCKQYFRLCIYSINQREELSTVVKHTISKQ